MKKDFEIQTGKKYPILWRKKGSPLTDKCPFCGKKHAHVGEGHRVAHCSDTIRNGKVIRVMEGFFLSDETYVAPKDGYIIREY